MVENLPASAGEAGDSGSLPGLGRSPWRRAWQPTPVFLPGESHGQRSLVGYGLWGHKESDTSGRLGTHTVVASLPSPPTPPIPNRAHPLLFHEVVGRVSLSCCSSRQEQHVCTAPSTWLGGKESDPKVYTMTPPPAPCPLTWEGPRCAPFPLLTRLLSRPRLAVWLWADHPLSSSPQFPHL